MTKEIKIPFLGANDDGATVRNLFVDHNKIIRVGEILCELETTKSVIDVESSDEGYFFSLVKAGDLVKFNQVIGYIDSNPNFNLDLFLEESNLKSIDKRAITKKAELLIKKYSLNRSEIEKYMGDQKITEESVMTYLANQKRFNARIGIGSRKKIGVIGGVSGGGALIVIDTINRINEMQAVGVYDRNERFNGESILGVPIHGSLEQLKDNFKSGLIDAVVIAFNRNLLERDSLYCELKENNIPFVNVIDPSVQIRSNFNIGEANIILANAYIGASSSIGNNNFISANVFFEHGNVLGSSCAFGPGVFTSGNVTIGDRVRFGTGIFVEPNLSIESDSVIGSGQVVVTDINGGTINYSHAKARI
jgi:sugar O-acyltransferase (sialic acid O-acetyltransferase NeuD family)